MPTPKFATWSDRKGLLSYLVFLLTFAAAIFFVALAPRYAQAVDCPPGTMPFPGNKNHCTCPQETTNSSPPKDCGAPTDFGGGCTGGVTSCLNDPKGFLQKDVQPVIDTLSGLVGVAVVGTIILGGIQYSTAGGDNADASAKAKKRIVHGVTALIAFLFVFAFIQWLIPGGIFG